MTATGNEAVTLEQLKTFGDSVNDVIMPGESIGIPTDGIAPVIQYTMNDGVLKTMQVQIPIGSKTFDESISKITVSTEGSGVGFGDLIYGVIDSDANSVTSKSASLQKSSTINIAYDTDTRLIYYILINWSNVNLELNTTPAWMYFDFTSNITITFS